MLNVQLNNLSEFLIDWNNYFPLDRLFRKKNNIIFNSKEHREICYIDLYMDSLEDKLFENHISQINEKNEKLEIYEKTGKWFNSTTKIDKKTEIDLFDKLDVSSLNSL